MSRCKISAKKKTFKKKSIVPRKPDGKIDWRKYDKALVKRGSITLWIDAEVVSGWVEEPSQASSIKSCRLSASRNPARIILPQESFPNLKASLFSGFCGVGVYDKELPKNGAIKQ